MVIYLNILVSKWRKNKRLDFLGIPTYWGSGLSEHNGTRYDLVYAMAMKIVMMALTLALSLCIFCFSEKVQVHGDGPPGH